MTQSKIRAADGQAQRRSYGTGSRYARTDRNGRETWYGHWRVNDRQVRRRIGIRRTAGSREGRMRSQARAELRRLIGDVKPAPRVGELLTVDTSRVTTSSCSSIL